MTHYKETKYGFEYGSAKVERIISHEKYGNVLRVLTPKALLEIRVTKTGLVRVKSFKIDKTKWVKNRVVYE